MDKYIVEMLLLTTEDLNDILLYYKISIELGDKFYTEIRSIIESLKINPF